MAMTVEGGSWMGKSMAVTLVGGTWWVLAVAGDRLEAAAAREE